MGTSFWFYPQIFRYLYERGMTCADLFKALGECTPSANWNGGYYIDQSTGVRAKNQILIYMDTYILGQGFLKTTELEVPEKYFKIKFTK